MIDVPDVTWKRTQDTAFLPARDLKIFRRKWLLPLAACFCCLLAASASSAPWSRLTSGSSKKPAANKTPWIDEREIAPYIVRSEFALSDVDDLVQSLGDLQADIEDALKLECSPQEIQIHLFLSKRTYGNYMKKIGVPEGASRQALFIPNPGRVYAYLQRDIEIDVRHETTHALLHTALPYVPIWIDEGLAEYFEVPAASRLSKHPHRKELQNAIRFQYWRPKLEQLEAKRKLMDMDGKDYRDSWGIVHFLLHGPPEAREALSVYFEEIQSGAAPTPLSKHLRRRLPYYEQAIIDHLSK